MCHSAHRGRRLLVFVALVATSAACGSDVRTVDLVRVAPAADPGCGAPTDGLTLIVSALGDFAPSEATGRPVNLSEVDPASTFSIESFPAGTRVIELVVIGSGGVTRTVGRTAEFELESLEDGDQLPVFMAPRRGFCPTGASAGTPRRSPLLARAGDDVLIAGGVDGAGGPVDEVQLYRSSTGVVVSLGDALYGRENPLGLAGASMTALEDGRVVVAGGPAPAFQVFDPAEERFSVALFLPDARSHHAAVGLGGSRVLLAGGCDELDATGGCVSGRTLTTSTIVDVDEGTVMPGPSLARARRSASAFLEPDGRVLIVGGIDDAGEVSDAERVDPLGVTSGELIAGASGVAASLADGGVLAGLAPAGSTPRDGAAIVPQGGAAAAQVASVPGARAGATLTALEDGRVLVLGGLDGPGGDEAVLYEPDLERFARIEASPDAGAGPIHRREHGAVRLADGTVLIVGGIDTGGAVLDDTWIFRPDLTGAFTSDATISFGAAAADLAVVPRDPSRFRREPGGPGVPPMAVLESSGAGGVLPSQWALVSGPRFVGVTLTARVGADGGGAALISGFVDAGHYSAVVLIPGQTAQLYDVIDGVALLASECQGEVIDTADLGAPTALVDVALDVRDDRIEVAANGRVVLRCSERDEPGRGLVGLGVIGASGATLGAASISAAR